MERGKASIANNVGVIFAQSPPSRVYFAPSAFPMIVNDEEVYFQRVASNPGWAAMVVSAPNVDHLVLQAAPPAGLTRGGQSLLLAKAAQFVAEVQAAPTVEHAREHLNFARNTMLSVSNMGSSSRGPLGVRAIRDALK